MNHKSEVCLLLLLSLILIPSLTLSFLSFYDDSELAYYGGCYYDYYCYFY